MTTVTIMCVEGPGPRIATRRKTCDVTVVAVSQGRRPIVVLREVGTGQIFAWQCSRGKVHPDLMVGRSLRVKMTPYDRWVFMPDLFEGLAILTSRVVPYRPLPPRRIDS